MSVWTSSKFANTIQMERWQRCISNYYLVKNSHSFTTDDCGHAKVVPEGQKFARHRQKSRAPGACYGLVGQELSYWGFTLACFIVVYRKTRRSRSLIVSIIRAFLRNLACFLMMYELSRSRMIDQRVRSAQNTMFHGERLEILRTTRTQPNSACGSTLSLNATIGLSP